MVLGGEARFFQLPFVHRSSFLLTSVHRSGLIGNMTIVQHLYAAARHVAAFSVRILRAVSRFGNDLMGLLLPRGCAGCGAPDEILCSRCGEIFHGIVHRPMPQSLISNGEIISCASYEGIVRRAILQWKDHGDLEVGRVLSEFLSEVAQWMVFQPSSAECRSAGEEGRVLAVIPVPSSLNSRLRRGRLQTQELATAVTDRLLCSGIEAVTVEGLSMGTRGKKSVQTSGVKSRQLRARGGQRVLTHHFPENCGGVLLIDDICTTGSTILGCARLLHAYGYRVVAVITLASVLDTEGMTL